MYTSVTRSGRQPGNEAIGTRVIYSESDEAPASSASMLGMPMLCIIVLGDERVGHWPSESWTIVH